MIDRREETIIKVLEGSPKGLGFNKLARKTGISPNTLRKKLKKLLKNKLIKQQYPLRRKGQDHCYSINKAYREFLALFDRLDEQTDSLMKKFDGYKIKNTDDATELRRLILSMRSGYSLPYLFESLQSWEPSWAYNEEILHDVLFLWYASFVRIKDKLDAIVENPDNREILDEYVNQLVANSNEFNILNPKLASLLDKTELQVFNLYRDPAGQQKKWRQIS